MTSRQFEAGLTDRLKSKARRLRQVKQVFPLLLEVLRDADIDFHTVTLEGWKQLVLVARKAMRTSAPSPPMNGKFYHDAHMYTR